MRLAPSPYAPVTPGVKETAPPRLFGRSSALTQEVLLGTVQDQPGGLRRVDAQAAVGHRQLDVAVVTDSDRLVPAQDANPLLAGVPRPDVETLSGGPAVGQDDGEPGAGVGLVALSREADDVGVVEGVVLGAVGQGTSHGHEQRQLGDGWQVAGLGRAEQVAPEDTGGSGLA